MLRRIIKIGAAVLVSLAAFSMWSTYPVGPAHMVKYARGGEYQVSVLLWRSPQTAAQYDSLELWFAKRCAQQMMSPGKLQNYPSRQTHYVPYWVPPYATNRCSA